MKVTHEFYIEDGRTECSIKMVIGKTDPEDSEEELQYYEVEIGDWHASSDAPSLRIQIEPEAFQALYGQMVIAMDPASRTRVRRK